MEEELRWDESSIIGMSRWLKNCDKLVQDFEHSVGSINHLDLEMIPLDCNILKTIEKVYHCKFYIQIADCFTKTWNFHNAISALIIFFNSIKKSKIPWTNAYRQKQLYTFIQVMHPFAPQWSEGIMKKHKIPFKWPQN
jgi:leucyl-tRNA synthetase